VLEIISDMFKVTLDELLRKDLSVSQGSNYLAKRRQLKMMSADRNIIHFVPVKAAAGYLAGYADSEFIDELNTFTLPMLTGGNYRAFEIIGDSMMPTPSGSIIVGEKVENLDDAKSNLAYIVVSKNEGIVYKRVVKSKSVNGKDGREQEATTDTTVQEKNITYPTDNKLHRRIIKKCVAIADKEAIELRQSYTRVLKKLLMDQRFRNHPKNKGKAKKADKKIKTIAGRLIRELDRKLPPSLHQSTLALFKKVLAQKKTDSNKIYSLHEPHVQCISKGKEHKKYEFGSKVSIITTKNTGVIIGAINIEKNVHDSKTLEPAIKQQQQLTGIILKNNFVDRGYPGVKEVLGTKIIMPDKPGKDRTPYEKQKLRKGFKRRAAIEPKIGHLKQDHRLSRNFYSGIKGDNINVMLAAAAMNFKRMMNIYKKMFFDFFMRLIYISQNLLLPEKYFIVIPK
jgi:IS5 family transposase